MVSDAQKEANLKWRRNHKKQYKLSMYGSYAKYFIRHCTVEQFLKLQLYMDARKLEILKKLKNN